MAILLCTVLLLPAAAVTVSAQERHITVDAEEVVTRSVTVPAPAVGETQDGALVGIASTLEIAIRNGTGSVYVDTRSLTQLDMQGSARLAAATASALAGRSFLDHDYFVTMRADAPTVGGPSAGGIMAVAFASLLLDWPIRADVVMTGMINPDGTIGPVGGIFEKAGAAASQGADLFLIPEGQSIQTIQVPVVEGDGFFRRTTYRTETIDVAAAAEREFGIEVREVSDILEAIGAFTGRTIEVPAVEAVAPSQALTHILEEVADERLGAARDEEVRLRDRVEIASDNLSSSLVTELEGWLDAASARLDDAEDAADAGQAYTAASRIFQARIDLRRAEIVLDAVASDDETGYLAEYGRNIVKETEILAQRTKDHKTDRIAILESIGAAQVRILEAMSLAETAETALQESRVSAAIDALAFAEERRRSVAEWLDLADRFEALDESARITIDPESLAAEVFTAAREAYTYAAVLLGETGQTQLTASLLAESVQALQDAQRAFELDLALGGMYRSLEAQTAAHAALSLVGSENLVGDRLARQTERASQEIAAVRATGAEPVLALSLFEFAGSLEGDQPTRALLMYGSAATVARISATVAGATGCAFGGLACGAIRGDGVSMAYTVTDPWTGYLALGSVTVGFLAGMLVTMVSRSGPSRVNPLDPDPRAVWPAMGKPRRPRTRSSQAAHAALTTGRRARTAMPALIPPSRARTRR